MSEGAAVKGGAFLVASSAIPSGIFIFVDTYAFTYDRRSVRVDHNSQPHLADASVFNCHVAVTPVVFGVRSGDHRDESHTRVECRHRCYLSAGSLRFKNARIGHL